MLISETAARQLRRLSLSSRKRIVEALRGLAEDPFSPRSGTDIKKLSGTRPQKYRLRVGTIRAVYVVEGDKVKVIDVFRRGRGYR